MTLRIRFPLPAPSYMNIHYNRFRANVFAVSGTKCVRCESTEYLEIDHIVESEKSFDVTDLWSKKANWPLILEELKKCQTLCSSCHAKKTAARNALLFTKDREAMHGSLSQYMRYGCRCELCKAVYSGFRRKWNEAKGIGLVRGRYRAEPEHGTSTMYRYGCRCEQCRVENTRMRREQRAAA